jgi:hypothetical protein
MSNDFLPADYEVPAKPGQYMKFEQGDNRFRFLDKPIIGNEYWVTEGKNRKPVRKREGEAIQTGDIEPGEDVKHFWAMPVFNYKEKRVQVLELTQKGLLKQIKALSKDEDWGSPLNYDLVVNKQGEKLDTTYTIQPKPAKELDEEIVKVWDEVKKAGFDITALYRGDDPFTGRTIEDIVAEGKPADDEINIDDIPF